MTDRLPVAPMVDADQHWVEVDVLEPVLDAVAAILRTVEERELRELAALMIRGRDVYERRTSAAMVVVELRRHLPPQTVRLEARQARDLADALRDAATAPPTCDRWWQCGRYAVNGRLCDLHGAAGFVDEAPEQVRP